MEDPHHDRLRAIEEAHQALQNHPGNERRQDLEGLWISIDQVMLPNLNELLAILRQPATDQELFAELIQNVRRPVVRERYQGEVTRRLCNYVASALALVDHVRRLARHADAPYMNEFRRRRETIGQRPEISFVQDLRNFTMHRRLPVFGHRATLRAGDDGERTEYTLTLVSSDLLGWDKWSRKSRQLIVAQPGNINLAAVVECHGQLMVGLNTWVHDRMQEDFEPIRHQLNTLVRRYNAVVFGKSEEEIDKFIRERLENMGAGPWTPANE